MLCASPYYPVYIKKRVREKKICDCVECHCCSTHTPFFLQVNATWLYDLTSIDTNCTLNSDIFNFTHILSGGRRRDSGIEVDSMVTTFSLFPVTGGDPMITELVMLQSQLYPNVLLSLDYSYKWGDLVNNVLQLRSNHINTLTIYRAVICCK